MTDKQIFIGLAIWFIGSVLIMFIPTGDSGEWVFIDYFHACITVPISAFWFWKYYKKL